MNELICKSCGANDLVEDGRYYVCQYCGARFLREVVRAASFEKQARLNDLLKRADLDWRHNWWQQAINLYRQAHELDANCETAKERLGRR